MRKAQVSYSRAIIARLFTVGLSLERDFETEQKKQV